MKTSFVALLTMAVGAFAGPIAVQRDTQVQAPVTFVTLTESVRIYTAQISKAAPAPFFPTLPRFSGTPVANKILPNYRQDPGDRP
jgi:hypothetical protein